MKKYKIWVIITLLLVAFVTMVSVIYACEEKNNPIKNVIASIDPDEITGCSIAWLTPYNEYYEYTETDAKKIKLIYEALSHMKFKEVQYDMLFDTSYRGMYIIQDEKVYAVFSYRMGTVVAPNNIKYMAEITNLDELEEKYGWKTILKEMILAAEAEREARVVEATEETGVTDE